MKKQRKRTRDSLSTRNQAISVSRADSTMIDDIENSTVNVMQLPKKISNEQPKATSANMETAGPQEASVIPP